MVLGMKLPFVRVLLLAGLWLVTPGAARSDPMGDGNPPILQISNLDADSVTSIQEGLFELLGTADDPDEIDQVSYQIGLYDADGNYVRDMTPRNAGQAPGPVDGDGWHVGRVPAGQRLATLDFTMVRNGVYDLYLDVRCCELNWRRTFPRSVIIAHLSGWPISHRVLRPSSHTPVGAV